MKKIITLLYTALLFSSCSQKDAIVKPSDVPDKLIGTWKLIKGTLVQNGVTTVTDYTGNLSFIKIINKTHFAFLQHDLKKGKDSASFVAGGGRYSISDSIYTEHLEYCSDRAWEGNDFSFSMIIRHDTLTAHGIEKVQTAGINRENTEMYVRMKD